MKISKTTNLQQINDIISVTRESDFNLSEYWYTTEGHHVIGWEDGRRIRLLIKKNGEMVRKF